MKGISEVIATILMLMITLALAGTAYLFISSAFTQQTQGIEITDAFCVKGVNATIIIRNVGTNPISFVSGLCSGTGVSPCGGISITRTSGGGGGATPATVKYSGDKATIDPGTISTLVDGEDPVAGFTGCTTTGQPTTCVYRISPPSGRSIVATVTCSG